MTTPNETPTGNAGGNTGAVGALLQFGGAMYDSYQDRKTSRENTDKTIAANKYEAELAYQRNLQMWNMQNQYNTPEAQMARFKDAGLNPHLIYGQKNEAGTPAQYQPPQTQYRYEAGNYGAGIASILPTLMQIGTWTQDMRLKEQQLETGGIQQEKLQQIIDFLSKRNPQILSKSDNELSLFPYQFSMQKHLSQQAGTRTLDMLREYDNKWSVGGTKELGLDSMRQDLKSKIYKNKLLDAQSSWTDYDITNPQALIQMVLSGAMGLMGQTLKARPSLNQKTMKRREGWKDKDGNFQTDEWHIPIKKR